jgi:hypothetical protein
VVKRSPPFGDDVHMRVAKLLGPALGAALLALAPAAAANPFHFPLKVERQRLVDQGGRPFPLLADTATALLARLTRDEAVEYLRDRRIRGFTSIAAALGGANHTGAPAYEAGDLARPGEAYFAHVEQVVRSAAALGLLLCLDPGPLDGHGPERVRGLGRWLGARFARYPNLCWMIDERREPGRLLATELRTAAPGHLIRAPLQLAPAEGEPGGPTPRQVRRAAYQALLRGEAWAYVSPVRSFPSDWRARLELPGGASISAARRLLDSRRSDALAVDRNLVREPAGAEPITAVRAGDGSLALVYVPSPRKLVIDARRISGKQMRAWWFDPRTGQAQQAALTATTGNVTLAPAGRGPEDDWVLVLDDAGKWPRPPGTTD